MGEQERKFEEFCNFVKGLSVDDLNKNLNNYYQTAKENEKIFRNILRDLKENMKDRPLGFIIPKDLDYESDLGNIFERYSKGDRIDKFTILNLIKSSNDLVKITYGNSAPLSGTGATLEYKTNLDNSVEFIRKIGVWMS